PANPPGPPLYHAERYRSASAWLRGMGRGLAPPPARDVCFRNLGYRKAASVLEPRPFWHQAALLCPGGWDAALRVGDQGHSVLSGPVAPTRSEGAEPVPFLPVRARTPHHLPGRAGAAACAQFDLPGWAGRHPPLLGVPAGLQPL